MRIKRAINAHPISGWATMTALEIEQAVFNLEEIRIVIRASAGTPMDDFKYVRAAAGTSSISEWLQQRILPLTNDNEVVVIDGNGTIPHGRTKMSTLRGSYER
jgi:hypothetical protein